MNILEIKNISLSYNHVPVVKELSFRLQSGELVGLIGPNGCGKTSVIKALSRILQLRSGQVTLDGKDISQFSHGDLARVVGVVPQNPSLPATFTVTEIVVLGRNPHLGWLRSESARDLAIVRWAMEKTGVAEFADRKISELSGGERQRVTVARVLAQEPKVILMDEPTANLDISHQIAILDLMKSLCVEKKLVVLIALHDLNLAAQYCDRMVLLKRGQLYAEGAPLQVITGPNIREVYGEGSAVYPHPENQLPVVLLTARRLHDH